MVDSGPSSTPVWLFWPNIIGYARILLALISMWYFPSAPVTAMFCYALSAVLDAFDGWAARTYNQSKQLFICIYVFGTSLLYCPKTALVGNKK